MTPTTASTPAHDTAGGRVGAVVLCGGTSRRMGGIDKTALPIGNASVLATLVESLSSRWPVVCVGEERPLPRPVLWVREDPPLGGPVAGLAAGLAALPEVDTVVVIAGDQPFSGPAARACAEHLGAASPEVDAVAARQPDGRLQPLLAAYRRSRLAATLDAARVDGAGVHRTLSDLRFLGQESDPDATVDIDTPADLDAARRRFTSDGA